MADYYSILARAVSRLETNNAQVRQELYEYARAILNAHFDRSDPQISALGVIDERVEFETAILRVEAESQSMPERRLIPNCKNRITAKICFSLAVEPDQCGRER